MSHVELSASSGVHAWKAMGTKWEWGRNSERRTKDGEQDGEQEVIGSDRKTEKQRRKGGTVKGPKNGTNRALN